MSNFTKQNKRAEVAELFVKKYADQILPESFRILSPVHLAKEAVKGADVGCYIVKVDDTPVDDIFKNVTFISGCVKGVIEVKQNEWNPGTAHNAFPIDTIPINFEIREDQKDINSSPGWLRAMMFPEAANDYAKENDHACEAIQSVALVYMLERWQSDVGGQKPPKYYAAICFDDVPALMEKLKELMPEDWDLNHPTTIPQTEGGGKKNVIHYEESETYLSLNQWYVPFSKLEELATVTMIDDCPKMDGDAVNWCKQLRQRVEHLERKANGRKIDTNKPIIARDEKAEKEYTAVITTFATKLGLVQDIPNNRIILSE